MTAKPEPHASLPEPASESMLESRRSWTLRLRQLILRELPPEHLLPDREPAYVGSWVYVFGSVAIAAFILVVASGVPLAFFGPQWWQVSPQGHFLNSLHFWSTQMFFLFMVLHLWGQFFAAGWRDGRATTWMIGMVIFLASLVTAFTGYLVQQNFDSQWIAVNAKDAINAIGVGAFFNALNFGQMFGFHVVIFPLAIAALIALHIVWVRRRGVVKPIESDVQP
ncbi:MAG: cytochrome b N-terminal domain-containing protein [Candidatus Dormiibacterota bacterium]